MNGTLVPGITEQIIAIPEDTLNKIYKIMFSPLHTTSHNNDLCSNASFCCNFFHEPSYYV